MNDKTLCYGNGCPLKAGCKRNVLNNDTDVAHWIFQDIPYDITRGFCNYYIKKEDEKKN